MRSLISQRFDGSRGVAAKSVAGAAATTLTFLAFCWASAPQQPAESAVTHPVIDFEPIPPMTSHDVYLGWSRMPEWQSIDRHWITQTTDRRARIEITPRSQAVAQSQGAAPDPPHAATPISTSAPVIVASLRPDAFAHPAEPDMHLAGSLVVPSAMLRPRESNVPDAEPAMLRPSESNVPDAKPAPATPTLARNRAGPRVPPALGVPLPAAKPLGEHVPSGAPGRPVAITTGLPPAGHGMPEDITLDKNGNDDFRGFGPGGPVGLPDFTSVFGPPFKDHAGPPPFDPGFAPPAGPPSVLPAFATRSLKAPFTHGKTFAIATVPEPGTAALLVLGLGLLGGRGRWLRC